MKLFVSAISKNQLYFYLYLIFLFVSGGLLLLTGRDELFLWINSKHNHFMDFLMQLITKLGEEWAVGILLLIFIFVSKRYFFASIIAYLISTIITQTIKYYLPSDNFRPVRYFTGKVNLNLVEGEELNHLHSFPSGHTCTAFLVFAICALISKNNKVGLVCFVLSVLVGYSRIYLNQHFPEDVLGGSIIGVGVTIFIFHYFIEKKSFLNRYENIDHPFFKW